MPCRKQARWSETLSAYGFVIKHLGGSKNYSDGPSRWHDYDIGYATPVVRLLPTVSVEPDDNCLPATITAQISDPVAVDVLANVVDRATADGTDIAGEETEWTVFAAALNYHGRIDIPAVTQLGG